MSDPEPGDIERCRCCLRRVGTGHAQHCDWYDGEPDWPDEWTEVDPEALAAFEDISYNQQIGEATS